jgi:hypothetical protein
MQKQLISGTLQRLAFWTWNLILVFPYGIEFTDQIIKQNGKKKNLHNTISYKSWNTHA